MLRKLLATTAIAAVMGTGAYAADDAKNNMPIFSDDTKYESRVSEQGYFEPSEGQILAYELIGQTVYSSTSDDAEAIGDVNDILFSANGTAEAVIVGVGGFLGIGEKDVAVDFDKVNWVQRDGERWLIVDTTREQLENAPTFDRADIEIETEETRTTAMNTESRTEEERESTEMASDDDREMKKEEMASDEKAMEKDGFVIVSIEELDNDRLVGARVLDQSDNDIGEISEILTGENGAIEAFVVDVGGFLGLGEKQVAVSVDNIEFRETAYGNLEVHTPFTEEELENQTEWEDGQTDNYLTATSRS